MPSMDHTILYSKGGGSNSGLAVLLLLLATAQLASAVHSNLEPWTYEGPNLVHQHVDGDQPQPAPRASTQAEANDSTKPTSRHSSEHIAVAHVKGNTKTGKLATSEGSTKAAAGGGAVGYRQTTTGYTFGQATYYDSIFK